VLRILAGPLLPSEGELRITESPSRYCASNHPAARCARLVFQNPALLGFAHRSGQNVGFLPIATAGCRTEIRARVSERP